MFVLLLMAEILHQFIGSLSHYLPGFIHPRWCRISSINSMIQVLWFEKKGGLQDLPVSCVALCGKLSNISLH